VYLLAYYFNADNCVVLKEFIVYGRSPLALAYPPQTQQANLLKRIKPIFKAKKTKIKTQNKRTKTIIIIDSNGQKLYYMYQEVRLFLLLPMPY